MLVYLTSYGGAQSVVEDFKERFPHCVEAFNHEEADIVIEMSDDNYEPIDNQIVVRLMRPDGLCKKISKGVLLLDYDNAIRTLARFAIGLANSTRENRRD